MKLHQLCALIVIMLLSAAITVGTLCQKALGAEQEVDLLLVLAVDVSLSMSDESFRLEMQGYADAFRSPAVQQAIGRGGIGRIAVTLMQWSGYGTYTVSVGWTELESGADAERLAEEIERTERMPGGSTSISGAIDYGCQIIAASGFDSTRRVIDVSGDGRSNNGRDVAAARQEAIAKGITINGLPIGGGEPGLEDYYQTAVIGGPGAFMVIAHGYEDFGHAIARKLASEIAAIAPPQLAGR